MIKPTAKRIAFGTYDTGPVTVMNSTNMACNAWHTPAPLDIAEVRAGSNVTFHWSRWLHSHKGPITAWLAPYSGNTSELNVNKLEFFKIAEQTTDKNGTWWNDQFMDRDNNSWTVNIPADIKPGNYILRHEVRQ